MQFVILVMTIEENHEKAQTIAQHSCRNISERWYYRKRDNDFCRAHYFGGGWAHAEECTRMTHVGNNQMLERASHIVPCGCDIVQRRPQQYSRDFL
jgi:hypothetical protein